MVHSGVPAFALASDLNADLLGSCDRRKVSFAFVMICRRVVAWGYSFLFCIALFMPGGIPAHRPLWMIGYVPAQIKQVILEVVIHFCVVVYFSTAIILRFHLWFYLAPGREEASHFGPTLGLCSFKTIHKVDLSRTRWWRLTGRCLQRGSDLQHASGGVVCELSGRICCICIYLLPVRGVSILQQHHFEALRPLLTIHQCCWQLALGVSGRKEGAEIEFQRKGYCRSASTSTSGSPYVVADGCEDWVLVICLAVPPLPCCLCLGRGVSSVLSLAGHCVYTFFFCRSNGVVLLVLSDFAAIFFFVQGFLVTMCHTRDSIGI